MRPGHFLGPWGLLGWASARGQSPRFKPGLRHGQDVASGASGASGTGSNLERPFAHLKIGDNSLRPGSVWGSAEKTHTGCWAHSAPGSGPSVPFSPCCPQAPASAGLGAGSVGGSEWAPGALCPQRVLRAALGAAPDGPAGGVGHHRAPQALLGPGLGLGCGWLPTRTPPTSPGQRLLRHHLCSSSASADPWTYLSGFVITLPSGLGAGPGGRGQCSGAPRESSAQENHTEQDPAVWTRAGMFLPTPLAQSLPPARLSGAGRVSSWDRGRCPVPKAGGEGERSLHGEERLPSGPASPALVPCWLTPAASGLGAPRGNIPSGLCFSCLAHLCPEAGQTDSSFRLLYGSLVEGRGQVPSPRPLHQ